MRLLYALAYRWFSYKRYRKLESLGFKKKYYSPLGLKLFYFEKEGIDPPIIFIHGLLDASFGFRKLVYYLNIPNRILIPDIPGFGKSKIPKMKFLYRIDIFSKLIYDWIGTMGANVVLCGHSMGGLICQHIAIMDKHSGKKKVSKIILIAPGGEKHPRREEMRRILFPEREGEILNLIKYLYYEEFPETNLLARNVLLQEWSSSPYKYLTENTLKAEELAFIGNRASEISIPALIIGGENDEITSPAMLKKLKSYIKKSKIVFIKKAKHAIHLERPSETADQIRGFLK